MQLSRSHLESENSSAPTWVRWRIVALLVAFSFMSWLNRVSMSVAYDEQIKAELNISEEAIGTVYSSFFFAYMLCMTPGGWLVDRFGAKLALVAMGFGSALFGALTGLAGLPALIAAGMVLPALFAIRSVMGIFSARIYPAASRAVSFWVPTERRTLANGFVQGGAALGIAFAFPIFGALMDLVGWPVAFVCTGSLTALLALIWTFYAADHPIQHAGVNKAELRHIDAGHSHLDKGALTLDGETGVTSDVQRTRPLRLLVSRSLVLLTISYAALGYLEYLFFFWMHYYFDDVLHVGKGASRIYAMILFLAFAAGMIVGGWLADRLDRNWRHGKGRRAVALSGMIYGAAFLWFGLVVRDVNLIVTCLAIAMAGVGACESTVWTTAVELGGPHGGTAAGICNTGGNFGGLIAPVLTPFLSHQITGIFGVSEQLGWQWGIALGGLICLLGAVLYLWIDVER